MNNQFFTSPVGVLEIIENNEKIICLRLVESAGEENPSEITNKAVLQLKEYFAGERFEFDLPLEPKGTAFQQMVWQELCKIPYGELKCYEDIAIQIGNPKACRAVGMANNKNPIPIIIPCHRVVGKNGALVGYAYGTEIKKKLLEIEKIPKENINYDAT